MNDKRIYSVISIDDHPLFRKGVSDLIDMDDSLELVGEAANGQDGLQLAQKLEPDFILLDLNMRGMNGLETLKAIKDAGINSRILMLTVSDNEDDVVTALRLGADGYILKDMEPEDILEYLRLAAAGEIVISKRLTQLLAQALREEGKVPLEASSVDLTAREKEILAFITDGMSNGMIAEKLFIAEGTVKVHVKHILKKLDLHSRVEAVVWALKHV